MVNEEEMKDKKAEPIVERGDGAIKAYSVARISWENGEFSDWVGGLFPIIIDGEEFAEWEGVEDALSSDEWDDD